MTTVETSGVFSKDYFDNGLALGLSSYKNYLSGGYLPERIEPKAQAIVYGAHLQPGDKVLDFGCAAGYFVRCYRQKFGLDAYGIDVSEDALACAPEDIRAFLSLRQHRDLQTYKTDEFDAVIAKDVLEHIPAAALDTLIAELRRISKKLFISVPVSYEDNKPFIDPIDEQDPTHVIRFSKQSWLTKLGPNITVLDDVCEILKGKTRVASNLTALLVK